MHFETLAAHVGHESDPATGAVTPPMVLSTTFERAPDGTLPHGHLYSRITTPNRTALERALTALEGGTDAAAFSSGQAATLSVLHALGPGAHVVLPCEMYYNTRGLVDSHYVRWGLTASYVDMTDPAEVERAWRPETRLIWIETPSNPRLCIADIGRLAQMAHRAGALCAVDNTWATPLLQRPLELGADLAVHSMTKYLGGHSDLLGGCVVFKDASAEVAQRIRSFQVQGGAVPSAFDCWLLLRSLPTLACRVRAQCASARRIAEYLAQHPRVEQVHYPGLATHPQHAVAGAQMRDFGGMLSFEVRGGRAAAHPVAARVRLFIRATSLGGFESLIEHRIAVEGPGSTTPPGLLRCSIGLEHVEDLLADLAQALEG